MSNYREVQKKLNMSTYGPFDYMTDTAKARLMELEPGLIGALEGEPATGDISDMDPMEYWMLMEEYGGA